MKILSVTPFSGETIKIGMDGTRFKNAYVQAYTRLSQDNWRKSNGFMADSRPLEALYQKWLLENKDEVVE